MGATAGAGTAGESATVGRVTDHAELPRLVTTLAAAFSTDAVMLHLVPEEHRPRLLPVLFRRVVRDYFEIGEVFSAAGRGAALWAPPGGYPIGGWTGLRQLPMALRVFGRRPLRSVRTEAKLLAGLPDQPYWYLDVIGVDPAAHSRGIGSALLEAKLSEVDAAEAPAHLTASSARSRDLYVRHGFEVFEEFALPDDGPTLWRMWREPR
ncbi:GNAT family N-acetyltransferase [Thermoleophilia bacterium SCSIO 60948]|nr:GNAT family N-acetyltransferase [Thermoleophilia bacterium SCSIO 60948]